MANSSQRLKWIALSYINFIENIGIIGIATVACIAVVQVFYRYVLHDSLFWSEELMRYLMIWVVFLMAGFTYSRGELLGMSTLVERLPSKLSRVVKLLSRLLIIGFLLTVSWYGAEFAWRTRYEEAIALEFSMFWIHIAISVGALQLCIHVVLTDYFHDLLAEAGIEEKELAK